MTIEMEAGVRKITLANGVTEIYKKGEKFYDENGNQIPIYQIKGKVKGLDGICGHPTCSREITFWLDKGFEPNRYVCEACANEKNNRAKRMSEMFNQEYEPVCIKAE